MQHWLAFPWVRYTLWLTAGILLGFFYPAYIGIAWFIFFILSLSFLAAVYWLRHNKPTEQLLWGGLAFIMLFSLGYARTTQRLAVQHPQNPEAYFWWVELQQEPVPTAKSFRVRASVAAAAQDTGLLEAMVYLPKKEMKVLPEPGSLLLVKARLQQVGAPLNPFEFDNRRYLASQGVHYQLFATSVVKAAPPAGIFHEIKLAGFKSKQYLLQVIDSFVKDQQALAIVKAMVLGERSGLERSLRQAYANAGVMHVLAVSGLHVGMVYLLVQFLFSYFQKSWWKRALWLVLALSILWLYAWLTGMAPSTMRAALMFSMVALARAMRRSGNIYNSIAFSAFLLLLWDPLLIRQLGFQLSYLAVLGIVYLQPRISSWYNPQNSLVKKLWELFSVSLAAQLATFPLGLYYFHQFPTYFFVGNLLAVPLAFCILYCTLFLLLIHWLPFMGLLAGWLLNLLASALNVWVSLTIELPSSTLVATISTLDVLLMYASIIGLILMFRYRSFRWAVVNFCLLLMLGIGGLLRVSELRRQQSFTVYQIPGHTLLHFISGRKELLMPLGQKPKQQQLSYHVEPARIQAGLLPLAAEDAMPKDFTVPETNFGSTSLMSWQGLRVAVVAGGENLVLPVAKIPVDVLLLRQNPAVSLEELQAAYTFKVVVLDASNSQWYRQKAKTEANSLHLPHHITSEHGAYYHPL